VSTRPAQHLVGLDGPAGIRPVVLLRCSCGWSQPVANTARAVKAATKGHHRQVTK